MSDPVRRPGCLQPGPKSVFHHHGRQAFGIKDGIVLEHEINGPGQFDGQDGVGFEFVAAHLSFQALGHGGDEMMIAFGNDGSLTEGPAQVRVAQFGAAQALEFAGTGDGAFDQAAVGQEVFDGGEAVDVADLVEDGHAQVFANARNGLQEGVLAWGRLLGEAMELFFESRDLGVEMADHGQFILDGQLADGMRFKGQEAGFPRIAIGTGLADGRAVMSQLQGLDAGQEIGALPDKEQALAPEGAQGALLGRVDIGGRDQIGAQEVGDFFGVNAVVLVLAAMDGFEVEGVGQDEGEAGVLAGIGQPIPAEHAFAADGQIVLVGLDELEEELEVIVANVGVDEFLALPVHEADVHLVGVEVDSAVELCGGGIILHRCYVMSAARHWLLFTDAGSVGSTPRPETDAIKTQRALLEDQAQCRQRRDHVGPPCRAPSARRA